MAKAMMASAEWNPKAIRTINRILVFIVSTAVGLRDLAVLLLMTRLGLRAVEVARLRLEDVDWRGGEVVVRGKGGRVDRMPLPGDVGAALAGYLRHGRRRSRCREVFVRAMGPDAPMARHSIVMVPRRSRSGPASPSSGRTSYATELPVGC